MVLHGDLLSQKCKTSNSSSARGFCLGPSSAIALQVGPYKVFRFCPGTGGPIGTAQNSSFCTRRVSKSPGGPAPGAFRSGQNSEGFCNKPSLSAGKTPSWDH